jgi:hypothetical protein
VSGSGFVAGRYRLEVSEALRAFVERTFVAPLPSAERDAARAETARELETSELELSADGTLVSRANGVEALRVRVPAASLAERVLSFEKAPGVVVRLECISPDVLVALHPGKPPLTFRRA